MPRSCLGLEWGAWQEDALDNPFAPYRVLAK